MLVKFSRQYSLPRAVSMTFDGQHPCPLCHFVKNGVAKEQQEGKKSTAADETLQLGLPPELLVLVHPPVPRSSPGSQAAPDDLHPRPPPPPPRPA
jgi:hypothetical protein